MIKSSRTIIIQGEVENKTVDLSSKITGRVEKINVEKGSKVKVGDVLVVLDTPEMEAKAEQSDAALEAAMAQQAKIMKGARSEQIMIAKNTLEQAQVQRDLAKKTYDRMQRLHTEGVIPTQKLDEAQAKYTSAQRSVESAQSAYNMYLQGERSEDKMTLSANVKRAQGAQNEIISYLKENKIKSPINGEVVDVTAEEGELVSAGYPIVNLIGLDDVWVTFNLREDLLSKIQMGSEFYAKFPALGNKKVKLKVNYISALGNFATWRATKAKGDFDMKTFEVHAVPVEKVENLRAGMSAIVDWNSIK